MMATLSLFSIFRPSLSLLLPLSHPLSLHLPPSSLSPPKLSDPSSKPTPLSVSPPKISLSTQTPISLYCNKVRTNHSKFKSFTNLFLWLVFISFHRLVGHDLGILWSVMIWAFYILIFVRCKSRVAVNLGFLLVAQLSVSFDEGH
ncbi:hypothetical protein AMTRI_Chr09g36540 [Amborella trichopoda]